MKNFTGVIRHIDPTRVFIKDYSDAKVVCGDHKLFDYY
jgi:hypothetical protein